MINVGVVGISGYSGELTLKLLLGHPQVRVTYVSANTTKGNVEDILPSLKGKTKLYCNQFKCKEAIELCDLIFLAVPHTTSMNITPKLLEAKKRVIDLSADYRLKTTQEYKRWYNATHSDKKNLTKAVYGLPELYREKIKKAALIANPGCYPTAAILSLAPIVATHSKSIDSITIDAKSGVTGAGRKAALGLMFSEVNESLKPYKVLIHQHTPEMELYCSKLAGRPIHIDFVPHLLPINRGILETIYVRFSKAPVLKNLSVLYKKFYKTENFVRVLNPDQQAEIKNVVGSNYCDIGITPDDEHPLLVITSAIDNLMKGAAGQAVQNMNIMYGFNESLGLT